MKPGLSYYVASDIACWLDADIHSLDTHATWSATLCYRHEKDARVTKLPLFLRYQCDIEVLLDWMKRHVIGKISKATQTTRDHVQDNAWERLEETKKATVPILSISLNDEAIEYDTKYREPSDSFWYEIVVDNFTDANVSFGLTVWGYKYALSNLVMPKDPFYILTDRLEARIRFIDQWTSIDEARRQLSPLLNSSHVLQSVKADLEQALSAVNPISKESLDLSCRAIFPLLERLLRDIVVSKGWVKRSGNLDTLITTMASKKVLQEDTLQVLRLVAKPIRDFTNHGFRLAMPVEKVVFVSTLDVFARIANDLDASVS